LAVAFFVGAFFAAVLRAGAVVDGAGAVAGAPVVDRRAPSIGSTSVEAGLSVRLSAGRSVGQGAVGAEAEPDACSMTRATTRAVVRTPVVATPTDVPMTAAAAWAGSVTAPETRRMGFTIDPLVKVLGRVSTPISVAPDRDLRHGRTTHSGVGAMCATRVRGYRPGLTPSGSA
jgi:hypothetical protein